jgi:dolichyl-phosphate-mannose-protein mannosyltransferase
MKGIKPWELAALAALTILFLAFASVNMGSLAMPSSSWQPSTSTSTTVPAEGSGAQEVLVVIDLGSVQHVNEIYVFLSDEKRTKFELYGGTSSDDRRPLAVFDKDPATHIHFSSWERLAIGNKTTSSLIFVFDACSDGKIGEIVILSAANEKIAPVDVTGGEGAQRLVDEQDIITLPITQKYGAYFDEMYFARTAQEHLKLEEPYEWTHPPLGKLIIGFGIALFGMNPFGWRILGVFAAAAMIPLMFLFGKRMFKSSLAGFIAAFLITFDFMHFSLARLATGEIYLLLFSLLMFYFAFDFLSKREEYAAEEEGVKNKAATSLFLSIVCFGLGFSVKWTALFGLIAVLILVVVSNIQTKRPLLSDSKTILAGLLVAVAIYIATYIPYMLSGEGHGLIDIHRLPLYIGYLAEYVSTGTINPSPIDSLTVFDLQLRMFGYHAGIEATHPYSSPWWSWPLMLKPLWMYSNTLSGGTVSTITLMGNPALWWGGIPAVALIGAKFVRDTIKKTGGARDSNFVPLFILVPFLLQWLPYLLITRVLFIYHFVANVPFMIFAVTYWLQLPFEKDWPSRRTGRIVECLVIALLVLVAVLFFLFYPVISGYPVAYEYKESLRWLSGWVF